MFPAFFHTMETCFGTFSTQWKRVSSPSFFALALVPLARADASATATLAPDTIRVGDPATLTVDIRHPADCRPVLPALDRGDDLRVLSATLPDPVPDPTDPAYARTVASFRITSFAVTNDNPVAASNAVIAFRPVAPNAAAADLPDAIPFPFANLAVESTLAPDGSTELQPIELVPLDWPAPSYLRPLLWTLGILAALVAAYFLVRWALNRRLTIVHLPLPRPAHETALAALDDLAARHAADPIPPEPFVVELSDILRRYLEERFALHAPTSTTDEFIRAAASANLLEPRHQALVADFLRQSDLVKFARASLSPSEQSSAIELARRVVLETVPAPPPTE